LGIQSYIYTIFPSKLVSDLDYGGNQFTYLKEKVRKQISCRHPWRQDGAEKIGNRKRN
jgi:hypothetical protein